jgi:hypothetical protein
VCERLNLRVAPNGVSCLNASAEAHRKGDQSRPDRSKPRIR